MRHDSGFVQSGPVPGPHAGLVQETVCFAIEWPEPQACDGMHAPVSFESPELWREREFKAGRLCAAAAISTLAGVQFSGQIPRGIKGRPSWPEGFVGSIAHCRSLAVAVVGRSSEYTSLGIDSEPLFDQITAAEVKSQVLADGETFEWVGLTELAALTLSFSAKEAFYKCLNPLVDCFFGFHDARLQSVDVNKRTFELELLAALSSEFRQGQLFSGRFVQIDSRIHTVLAFAH